MKRIAAIGIFLFFIAIPAVTFSQGKNIFTEFRSTFKRAENYYKNFSFAPALELYQKAYARDSSNGKIRLRIADCYRNLNDSRQAEIWYEKGIGSSAVTPEDELHYAQVLLSNQKYEESKKWFRIYNEHKADAMAQRKMEGISNLTVYYEDSLNFPSAPVSINSEYADFSPAYYADGIVFVSSREDNGMIKLQNTRDNSSFYDLYYSKFNKDGSLSTPVKFSDNIHHKFHEGPVTFYNKDTKMIFTRNGPSGIGSKKLNRLTLYSSEKDKDGKWVNIKPMPFNNNDYSVGHATITPDGKNLFFVSDMPGGFGETDIYWSQRRDTSWSAPVNLGPEVNTSGSEVFPFVQNDSTIYFASNGFGGLGGLDIYKATLKDGKWDDVKNMGYPVNSNEDDFGLVLNADGKNGFYCSNRKTGGSNDDIYAFEVINVLFEGIALTKLKNKPLENVRIKLYRKDKELLSRSVPDNGKFSLNLDPGKEYNIVASCDNYKTIRTTISTRDYEKGKVLRKSFLFEKSLKDYVMGIVKLDTSRGVANTKVYYQEKGTGEIDTLMTNERGEFECEIESEVAHLFFTEKNGMFDTLTLKTVKKKKGSAQFYLYMRMEKYTLHDIAGIVKDSNSVVAGAAIFIKDLLTGKTDTLAADAGGKFLYQIPSYGRYDIRAEAGGKTAVVRNFNINLYDRRKSLLELFLHREEQ